MKLEIRSIKISKQELKAVFIKIFLRVCIFSFPFWRVDLFIFVLHQIHLGFFTKISKQRQTNANAIASNYIFKW